MLSQEALAAILQRAANAIYQATGKIITGITPTPPSASLLPVSTPYPPTQDSGGGILSFLPNALTSLPLPMLIGVIAAGVILLFIIIIFLISTTVIMWGYTMCLWWKPLVIWFLLFQKRTLQQVQGAKTEPQTSEASSFVHPGLVDSLTCLKMPFSYTYVVDIVYYMTFVLRPHNTPCLRGPSYAGDGSLRMREMQSRNHRSHGWCLHFGHCGLFHL